MDKDTRINIRVSEKMKEFAKKRCEEIGMNLSDYIRYLIMKDVDNKK